MKITLENFKNFALNNPLNKTVDYCEQLVEKQGIESVELGPLLCEMHGTFYCPDEKIARKFDFNGEVELTEDIKEIVGDDYLERGLSYDKAFDLVSEQFHGVATFYDNGFYGSDDIIFVDTTKIHRLV